MRLGSRRARHRSRRDRATRLAAAWTLAAALPVHLAVVGLAHLAGTLASQGEPPLPAVSAPIPSSQAEPTALPPAVAVAAAPEPQVSGLLRTPDRTPVPNETVELESASLGRRYVSMSDTAGRFTLTDVEPASDYEVRVESEGRYRDHVLHGVVIPETGLALELVLEPLVGARLEGRMVDSAGDPLPLRTLLMSGSHWPGMNVEITGDERGAFVIEGAPTGRLEFSTRTVPHLRVRGPLLTPGSEQSLVVVLDEGEHTLVGRVLDARGDPLRGAVLRLSWSHRTGDSISSSTRTAATGADGRFRFSDLGPGRHQLVVRAEGHAEARETVDLRWNSGDVELRLRGD